MKVLVVSLFLPYPGVPHAGGKLVYFLLQTLSRNHSVTLVSRYFPGEERHFERLRKILSGIELVSAPGPLRPGSISSYWRTVRSYRHLSGRARNVLDRERFDVCQVEFTETGMFWIPPSDVPAVLTCHDIIAKPAFRRYESARGFFKVLHWCLWRGKRVMEKRALSKFSGVFTLSDEDCRWGERFYPGVSFQVLRYPGGLGFTGLPRKEVAGRILFLGALHRPQNVDAVQFFWRKVWPAVRQRVPDAEFWVAGSGLPDALERELAEDPRVVLTGFVENIEEIYKSASVFVAPVLTGGGIIVKILDALAAGIPVVTTTFGNEGIGAIPGKEILIADAADDYLSDMLRVLEDARFRFAIGEAGSRFVGERFSPLDYRRTIEHMYDYLASHGRKSVQ